VLSLDGAALRLRCDIPIARVDWLGSKSGAWDPMDARRSVAGKLAGVYRSELHLWVLTLAGIAAFQQAERAWFVDKLRVLARRKGLLDWSQVLPVLESFLWMDMACGAGGMSLWDEVQAWTPGGSPSDAALSP
jgi:hypothetical protein